MKTCCLIGALGLAACGGGARPAAVVVATTPASTAECPFGGAVVSTGSDDNGNGMLDDVEIADRVVVCSDPPVKPPPVTLVRLVAEPIGAHCALAGTAVQSGPDRNGNGVLDDDEVTHIDYACGEPLLTRLAPAPPDAQCVAGGVAFLAGRDHNHDGKLEDNEVEERHVACGDELAGDIAVGSVDDAAALAGIAVITGSLTVDATAVGELAMPRLVQVRGGIEIKGNAALVRVALPALQTVDGVFALALDPQLTTLELPLLHRVGGLVIDGTALADLHALAALDEVFGDVQISNNPALGSLALPPGRVDGMLAIDRNAQLATISASLRGRLGAVHISTNPQLTGIDLAGAAAGRLTTVGGVTVMSNNSLERVALDADDFDAITIGDDPRLAEVAVTGVQVSGDVWLGGDGEASLAFTAVADAFTIVGSLRLSGPFTAITSSRPLIVKRDCLLDMTLLTAFGPDVVSRVDGGLTLSNNPRLTSVATIPVGSLEVSGNHALTELNFDLGDFSGGQLTISNNATLQSAPFDRLRFFSGYVMISGNPALKTVFGPSLEWVSGALTYFENDSLTDLGLTNLRFVGGLQVVSCNALTEIDLPALSRANIFITRIDFNQELRHIHFPVLRFSDFEVLDNPHLPTCEVTALFAVIGGDHHQSGNDDAAVCP
jgi:hypothetical protein